MPEYKLPGVQESARLDKRADEKFATGQEAAENADDYVRTTVYLATVLFLVGISGHFRVPHAARIGLVVVGVVVLGVAGGDARHVARSAVSADAAGLRCRC